MTTTSIPTQVCAIPEERFACIEGVVAREPLIQDNPADPRNRRISILLLP